ncbi:unnamed protein product [Chironomus riparius]|uniref:Uncharacterized protein n=1 Tax=Chironomus riparius TaxID=315576 RepID=A0A9N9S6X8_9DIPT|nr:unnamed protein product [Chironomus riparius]
MSKINLILLISFAVLACCTALPRPNDEVVDKIVDEVPVEAEVKKDEVELEDSARIHRPHNPLLNPHLNSNVYAHNPNIYGAYSPTIITKAPLSFDATIVLNPVVPGQLIGKK